MRVPDADDGKPSAGRVCPPDDCFRGAPLAEIALGSYLVTGRNVYTLAGEIYVRCEARTDR
ncbi:MAG: hypothetical protein LAP85_08920 [Acidobacteriia bacterium]|nr:hypothetical protein [Terriglobia bacterium]